MKTVRERAEERREEKLDQIREQVANGSLIIRTMSDEERRLYPPIATPRFTRRSRY